MQLTHTSRQPRSFKTPRARIAWALHMATTIEPRKPGTPARLSADPGAGVPRRVDRRAADARQPLFPMPVSAPSGNKGDVDSGGAPEPGGVPTFGVRAAHRTGIAEKEDVHGVEWQVESGEWRVLTWRLGGEAVTCHFSLPTYHYLSFPIGQSAVSAARCPASRYAR